LAPSSARITCADSRVFRRGEPLNAPAAAFSAKKISRGEFRTLSIARMRTNVREWTIASVRSL
jgi:hypothetical protein